MPKKDLGKLPARTSIPKFDQSIADYVCEQLAVPRSLRKICLDPGMPASSTIYRWLLIYPAFSDQYARARETQADAFVDEIADIADESNDDIIYRKHFAGSDESAQVNGDVIARAKLRIDARKWLAGKMRPKKYGDRMIMAGDEDAPIELNVTIGGERTK